MSVHSIGLFQGLMSKMDYLAQRQEVLSQNIANADTPGYKAKDLRDADFSKLVAKSNGRSPQGMNPVRTDSDHMVLGMGPSGIKAQTSKTPYEVSNTLNSVVIEEQMVKASKTSVDYQTMAVVYRRNLAMIRMAMGAGSNR